MNWISVNCRLPESDGQYLTAKRGRIEILTFNEYQECWDDADGDDVRCELMEIDYWMPLPALPEGK